MSAEDCALLLAILVMFEGQGFGDCIALFELLREETVMS